MRDIQDGGRVQENWAFVLYIYIQPVMFSLSKSEKKLSWNNYLMSSFMLQVILVSKRENYYSGWSPNKLKNSTSKSNVRW